MSFSSGMHLWVFHACKKLTCCQFFFVSAHVHTHTYTLKESCLAVVDFIFCYLLHTFSSHLSHIFLNGGILLNVGTVLECTINKGFKTVSLMGIAEVLHSILVFIIGRMDSHLYLGDRNYVKYCFDSKKKVKHIYCSYVRHMLLCT